MERFLPAELEFLKLMLLLLLLQDHLLTSGQNLLKLKMTYSSLEAKKNQLMLLLELPIKLEMMQTIELHLLDKILMQLSRDSKMNQKLFLMLPSILKELELNKHWQDKDSNNSLLNTLMLFHSQLFQMETETVLDLQLEITLQAHLLAQSEMMEMEHLDLSELTIGLTIFQLPTVQE